MTLIDKIGAFENAPAQTLCEFNKIFHSDGITFGNLEDEVVIGKILGPVNVRSIFIGGKEYSHTFDITSSVHMPGESYVNFDEKGVTSVTTNENLKNDFLTEQEMEMNPFEYMLLQYFRGAQSPYHTQEEIAVKLRKSSRGIRNVLRRMEEGGIITTQIVPKLHRMHVTITEDWI